MNYVDVPHGMKYDEFKTWLLDHCGMTDHPKADLFWSIAYDYGSGCGDQDVFILAQDLYELVSA